MRIVRRKPQELPASPDVTVQVQVTVPPKAAPAFAVRRPMIAGSAADVAQMKERAKADIEARLKLVSEAYSAIDQAQLVVEEQQKVIEARLKSVNLTEHTDGVLTARIKDTFSRQSSTIDPKKFRANVEADVFWSCIKVSMEKAAEHLSKKELDAISTVVESKKTGSVFLIERNDARRRKK